MNSLHRITCLVSTLLYYGGATLHVAKTWPLDPPIIPRAAWGAASPVRLPELLPPANCPVPYVIIHHSAMDNQCSNRPCCEIVKEYQDLHMKVLHHWNDIGYNFLVDPEGLIYEGRGWGIVGAHAFGYNSKSIGICLIGNFSEIEPTEEALLATKTLIQYGMQEGQISDKYILYGHREVKQTNCPGNNLFRIIQTWPHFQNNTTT